LFIIEQQFQAENSLLSDSSNNELFIYKFGNGSGRKEFYFPHLQQAVDVMGYIK